jgi:hypothetical protein
MKHDNITDIFTYLRLCSRPHKRMYSRIVRSSVPTDLRYTAAVSQQRKPRWKRRVRDYVRSHSNAAARVKRLRSLLQDVNFREESHLLRAQLGELAKDHHELLQRFFRRFGEINPTKSRRAQTFISTIPQESVQRVLDRWVRFGLRFQISAMLEEGRIKFSLAGVMGRKFHMILVGNKLLPAREDVLPDHDMRDYFESPDLDLLPQMNEAVKKGEVNFVKLDDHNGQSVLALLTESCYDPNTLTFVSYDAGTTVLMCLIGERTSKERLRKAQKLISEVQRRVFNRKQAGRPPQAARKTLMRAASAPGSQKSKVDLVPGDAKMQSKQSALSRAKRRLNT